MWACRELTWPGGYLAAARQSASVAAADVVAAVQPKLHLLELARLLGKETVVCWNGWDAAKAGAPLPTLAQHAIDQARARGRPIWAFVGRGDDPMKGAELLKRIAPAEALWFAAPGAGFEGDARFTPTGRLDAAQVRELLTLADGLAVPSRYEGLPLVVLEALGLGARVVAFEVGGLPHLSRDLHAFWRVSARSDETFARSLREAIHAPARDRAVDQAANRRLLLTWWQVAASLREAVLTARSA
jgi:glycosyltransferase involved in cell wall biosynthesis